MDRITSLLSDNVVLGISAKQYALAFLAILLAVVLRKVFSYAVIRALRHYARKTATAIDDLLVTAIEGPAAFAFIIAGLYAAAIILNLPEEPVNVKRTTLFVIQTLFIVDVTWLLLRLIDALSVYVTQLTDRTETKLDDQLVPIVRRTAKIFVSLLAFVFVVQNLGYSVGSLLAGLGIGGLAFALAAKDTLANLFGSVAILIDRPFRIGDWIETSSEEGVVEEIGFRSTRIRTFAKTQISVPNTKLANATVNNWSRMPIRRVKMTVGVTYESSAEQMEKAVEGIKSILKNHEEVSQDFYLVNFTDFGASSLDIFVYFFTKTTVWAEFLRVRQEVNLSIMHLLEELGMEIAFPSRSVYLHNSGDAPPAGSAAS